MTFFFHTNIIVVIFKNVPTLSSFIKAVNSDRDFEANKVHPTIIKREVLIYK